MARKQSEIVVIGTGGHARVVIGILQSLKTFRIKGLLDERSSKSDSKIFTYPVLGGWEELQKLKKQGVRHAALAIGDNATRRRLKNALAEMGFLLPPLIHRSAHVESSATIENGAMICLGAMIGAGAVIKEGALVNTGSIIDHETVLSPFVHVAPGCILAGRVTVGTGSFIGIGSRIIDHLTVGEWCTIGAGSIVVDSIPDHATAIGVPARITR